MTMRALNVAAPWGLDAINDIYLRNGSIRYVWPDIARLIGCGIAMLAIAAVVEQRRAG